MASLAVRSEYLDAAMTQAANAKTIDELRMAQALLLPLKFGLSLDDTGLALGISKAAPELNPIEHLWDDLREKSFHNRIFDSLESLEDHLELALANFEKSPERTKGITGCAADK